MGSNNNAAGEGHKGDDVVFKSKDIVSKTKARQKKEYFVKFKEKTAGQKFSEWFNKHKKKIIIIACIVVAAAVAIFAIIKIIDILNKPEEAEIISIDSNLSDIADRVAYKSAEVEEYFYSLDTESKYTDTINHFNAVYEAEDNINEKFAIAIAVGDFLFNAGAYSRAEEFYLLAELEGISNAQREFYYHVMVTLYSEMNDQDMIDLFDNKLKEL